MPFLTRWRWLDRRVRVAAAPWSRVGGWFAARLLPIGDARSGGVSARQGLFTLTPGLAPVLIPATGEGYLLSTHMSKKPKCLSNGKRMYLLLLTSYLDGPGDTCGYQLNSNCWRGIKKQETLGMPFKPSLKLNYTKKRSPGMFYFHLHKDSHTYLLLPSFTIFHASGCRRVRVPSRRPRVRG